MLAGIHAWYFAVLFAGVVFTASCDTWLHVCIEVGAGEGKLTPVEMDRAISLIDRFIAEEDLDCRQTEGPIGLPAEDTSFYETRYCIDPSKDRVRVEFALAKGSFVVELTDTGSSEPEFMTRARETLADQFTAQFGQDRVRVSRDCYR
jgi:hypothetical protein